MPQHKSGAKAQNVEPNRANYHDPGGMAPKTRYV